MTRNGKIARLPREIRDQLNRRLQNGEKGRELVDWLNSLPEVQRILAVGFGGRPINEPNLSAWKTGGYQLWLAQQEILPQVAKLPPEVREMSALTDGKLTDNLATIVAARYAVALAGWNGEVTEDFRRRLRTLHGLCRDVVQLRRGDQSGVRLDLQQEKFDWEREITGQTSLELPDEMKEFKEIKVT